MGVNITKIVPRNRTTFKALSGKVIALDAYNTIYQFLAIIRDYRGQPLRDRDGRATSHLSGLFYRNISLMAEGIKPVYVFDGVPPEKKRGEIDRRIKIKKESRVKYLEALAEERYEEAKKHASASSTLEDYMVVDAKRLLALMGIPVVEAPAEGEAQAGYIVKRGDAWASGSQDYDSLLFGSPRVVRNITLTGKRHYPSKQIAVKLEPEIIELERVLLKHKLTREQLVDVGILVGTDYNAGVRGLGPVKALQAINRHGRIEDIPGIEERISTAEVEEVRRIFLNPEVTERYNTDIEEPDEDGVEEFLCGEKSFSEDRVRKALSKLPGKGVEGTLDKWFS
ncbi:MAG: flap endonuclease-1 [Nitrososphaeria archaeon]|nr:flap endonuclease-1 [Nitrososphaeria archaeon]NIN53300.1 flap endonuclease-1 [Nitrososphaeria archaeon]NIQ33753.1 flap endonuclease-1 [Nitrososphaeria archaeon]